MFTETYLPYDFINGEAGAGELARAYDLYRQIAGGPGRDRCDSAGKRAISYKVRLRLITHDFIDTTSTHLCALTSATILR